MRSYETPRKLTYESFIETFGRQPFSEIKDKQELKKSSTMLCRQIEKASNILKTPGNKTLSNVDELATDMNPSLEQDSARDVPIPTQPKETRVEKMSKRLRKISLRKKDSRTPAAFDDKSNTLQRSKSVSFLGKTVSSPSWFSSQFNSSIHQKSGRKSPVDANLRAPMSKIASAAHRGYLTKLTNSKKSTNTRYWCILADSCLYCYGSQDDEFATDVIALGGYWLTTSSHHTSDYTSLSQSSDIVILMERLGKENYEFQADNEASFNEWMVALTQVVSSNKSVNKLKRSVSTFQAQTKRKLTPVYERSDSDICMDIAHLKAKLLKEVLAEQRKVIHEQQMLEELVASKQQEQQLTEHNVIFTTSNTAKTSSVASLTQSEDHGYCSSLDGSVHDSYTESEDSRQPSPSARSYRSMSTVSVASSISLSSIAEEKKTACEVSPKILAEIEEFRSFSQKTLQRKHSGAQSS